MRSLSAKGVLDDFLKKVSGACHRISLKPPSSGKSDLENVTNRVASYLMAEQ